MAVYYPSFASPVWPVATTVAAPAAASNASTATESAAQAPVATLIAAPTVVAAAPTANAFFWPANPQPSKFTLPCATNYKRWRNTEAELGRFDQWTKTFARTHGLM
jgi:hypothetical protein